MAGKLFRYDRSERSERRRASLVRARRIVWFRRGLVAAFVSLAIAAVVLAIVRRSDGRFQRGSVAFAVCHIQLVEARCGRVAVPEDPRRPGGARFSLRVAVVPAARQPAVGALFYLAGGPGGAASADVPAVDRLLGQVAAARDLVLVDQRGTGGSHALRCPSAAIRVARTEAVAAYVRRCFSRLGPSTRLYTTSVAADDLEAVRRALRYGPVDVYGSSYGATAAQVFLRRHPRSVRTLILDSGSLLGVPVYEALAANAERALRADLARCAADAACRRAFPHPRLELTALLGRPPTRVRQVFGRTMTMDADGVAATVEALSRDADGVALIPYVVHRAAEGDYVPLAQEYVDRVGADLDARARLAMSFEILCSEPWARSDLAARQSGYLSGVLARRARMFARACRGVPKGVVPDDSTRLVPTNVPVLLLAGGADPQDPPANMRGWKEVFPDGRLLVVRDATHGVLGEGCIPVLVAHFVERGSARGLDTSCVRAIEPQPFVIER